MWESAAEFGALLVFAEHRYYGESKPYSGSELHSNMQYLTAEQAMADYAELLAELKSDLQAEQSPVIGFGGSYGGMLASWMRMKYPHVLDGAIAGSAPIWAFPGEDPPVDSGAFAKIVTRDATPAGGSAQACAGLEMHATMCNISCYTSVIPQLLRLASVLRRTHALAQQGSPALHRSYNVGAASESGIAASCAASLVLHSSDKPCP